MTCVSCHNSHTKCIYSTIHQVRCDRCIKRDTDCFKHKSKQGERSDLLHDRDRSPLDNSDSVDVNEAKRTAYDEALMKVNAPYTRGSPSLVNDSFYEDDINDDDGSQIMNEAGSSLGEIYLCKF